MVVFDRALPLPGRSAVTSVTAARAADSSTMALRSAGGDEALDGQVVHGAGQRAGGLVDQRGVVVGDQSVAADDEANSDKLD